MTAVTLDDIIYRLQRFGGASDFWRSLSAHLARNTDLEITHVSGRPSTRLLPVVSSDAVLHSSHFHVPARRSQGCVTTIHDLTYELGLMGGRGAPLNRWQRKVAVEHADAIVCISEHTRNDLLTYYQGSIPTTEGGVTVIHHGRTYEAPTGDPIDAEFERYVPYVLHVGNRSGYKNFPVLAQAFLDSDLPGAGVSLLCTGAPFDPVEQAMIGGHRSSSSVHNVGQVTTEALGRLYEHTLGLAYPSAYEGFGLPPLDAMSLGCPVISTDNTSVPEIVGDAAILVDPADGDGFRSGLEVLLDPARRSQMAAAGTARASMFSWATAAERYANTYEGVASNR